MSVGGSSGALFSPASTDGDPTRRWKSKFVASANSGSAEKFPLTPASAEHPSLNSAALVERTTGGVLLNSVSQRRPSAITLFVRTAFPAKPVVFTPPLVFRATVLLVNTTGYDPTL